jgi:curved DNA-binding protein CbpA
MVPDPYKALNLPHTASAAEIKKSYRDLARRFHPDRMMYASDAEKDRATVSFAEIAGAYAILTDPQRKAQYDHIYRYGGYDDDTDDTVVDGGDDGDIPSRTSNYGRGGGSPFAPHHNSNCPSSRKRKSVGVGYSCTDPLAFIWTNGRIQTTTNVAGIQIPSRFQMGHPGAGLRVSFSSGEYRIQKGKHQFKSRTTQFAHGKKFTRTETTTIHADGKKEVLIEGDDYVERRTSSVQQMASHEAAESLPWYMSAWAGLKDKLAMCYAPCQVQ